jgi:hypothetical protein
VSWPAGKGIEYGDRIHLHLTPSSSNFYTLFFVFTRIHLLHLLVEMVGLAYLRALAKRLELEERELLAPRAVAQLSCSGLVVGTLASWILGVDCVSITTIAVIVTAFINQGPLRRPVLHEAARRAARPEARARRLCEHRVPRALRDLRGHQLNAR